MQNTKVNEIKVYDDQKYELVENLVVNEEGKKKLLIWLNVFAIIMLAAFFIVGAIGIRLQHTSASFSILALWIPFIMFVIYIPLHELIHGLVFVIAGGAPWKKISFGFVVKSGMAYCMTDVPISIEATRISLWAPFVIVCLPLLFCSVILGDFILLMAAALLSSGSVGDFWYLWVLRGKRKDLYLIEEKPANGYYQLGCLIYKRLN